MNIKNRFSIYKSILHKIGSRFIVIGILFLLIHCKTPADNQNNSACIPYFDFDKIEYYSSQIEEDSLWVLDEKDSITPLEKRLYNLILEYKPDELKDTSLLLGIEALGFVQKVVPNSKYNSINAVFCEKKHEEVIAYSCIAFYRDLLIFRKNGSIIGFARLCFDCDRFVIAGTSRNTNEFGQSGDFGRLWQLLNSASNPL